jgi:hypothetical protein
MCYGNKGVSVTRLHAVRGMRSRERSWRRVSRTGRWWMLGRLRKGGERRKGSNDWCVMLVSVSEQFIWHSLIKFDAL